MKTYKKILGVSLLATTLAACGGDDAGPNTANPLDQKLDTILAPMVQDQFTQVVLSEENRTVSLKNGVSDPQGLPVTLTSVTSITDNCDDPVFDAEAMTFTIDKNEPDVCYYDYTVQNHPAGEARTKAAVPAGVSATANSNVLISSSSVSGVLSSISAVAAEGGHVVINLNAELGTAINGYVLDNETVVLGSGSVIADSAGNTITYSAIEKGVSRVLYSLKDSNGDIKAGYIDIAVSGDGNGMPLAQNFAGPQGLTPNTPITIDVKDYISDPDGDSLQLTDVYAYNATVFSASPTNVDNTEFTFEAAASGSYDVSYYISDHRGGWAVAAVHITIEGPLQPSQPWDDITLSDNEFYTAPWEQVSADGYNIAYTSLETETIEGNDYGISLFSYDSAVSLCQLQGMMLPSEQQLQKLYSERGDLKASDSWPTGTRYWSNTTSGSNYVAVDLSNGNAFVTLKSQPLITTCVYPGQLLSMVGHNNAFTTTDPNSTGNTSNMVRTQVINKGGYGLEGALVYAYSTSPDLMVTSTMQTTDANGFANFTVRSLTAGDDTLSVSYFTQKVDNILTFIEDIIEQLNITGTSALNPTENGQLNVQAIHSSGKIEDVTDTASWRSTNDAVVGVAADGKITAKLPGSSTITAGYQGKLDIYAVTVDTPAILIIPPTATGEIGDIQQFSAVLAYSDGTTHTPSTNAWVSKNPTNVSINNSGRATANVAGSTQICYSEYGVEGCATYAVTSSAPTMTSIQVTPATATVDIGKTQQYTARLYYSDGSDQPAGNGTWSSVGPVGGISNSGLVTGQSAGSATVMYTQDGLSGTATITVNAPAPTLTLITVTPVYSELKQGDTQQYTAKFHYNDGTTATASDGFWSTDASGANISNSGLLTVTNNSGGGEVNYTKDGVVGSAAMTIIPVSSNDTTFENCSFTPSSSYTIALCTDGGSANEYWAVEGNPDFDWTTAREISGSGATKSYTVDGTATSEHLSPERGPIRGPYYCPGNLIYHELQCK